MVSTALFQRDNIAMKFSYRIYFESILFRCSDGFNFNLYKRHLEETVNSQGREQMHSLLEKCTQSLRLLSYRHFMIFLRVFFAMTNLHNRKYKQLQEMCSIWPCIIFLVLASCLGQKQNLQITFSLVALVTAGDQGN